MAVSYRGRRARMAKATLASGRVLEKVEQAHIKQLAETVGCTVVVFGVTRRGSKCECGKWVAGHQGTQQTPGIPDLEIWLPVRASFIAGQRELVKWETKAVGGQLSPEQRDYRDLCAVSGVTWGSGTYDDFIQFLVARGLVKADSVPHYRRPQEQP